MRMFKIVMGIFCTAFLCLSAQTIKTPKKDISIRTLEFKQDSDSVYLTYQVTPLSRIKKWDGYKIRCSIENGDSLRYIDSVQLMGKFGYIHAERSNISSIIHKWNKKKSALQVLVKFPYSEWMRGKSMLFQLFKEDCCTPQSQLLAEISSPSMQMQALPVPVPYAMQLHYTYLTPEAKAVKDMNNSGSAFLEFPAGKSQLLVDFKNNKYELSKIHAAIDSISNNKYASITGIELTGYASIDGNSKSNLRLSLSRAESVRRFVQSAYPKIPAAIICARAGGEDWNGLRVLSLNILQNSDITQILDMPASEDIKESRLKQLAGGAVYRVLSEEIFPQLRRVDYAVRYTVKGFTVEEGRELLKTAPGNLSLNELFLIANSYTVGSAEFQEVFDIAVRLYPQDTVARINAASVALERKDLQRASVYLSGLEEDRRALNNLALLYVAQGKVAEARSLLKKACASNDPAACQNDNEILKYLAQEELRSGIIRKNEGSDGKE